MSSEILYFEIFEEFEKAGTKEDKINVLKKYDSNLFRDFFIYLFNPHVIFDVTIPPYKPAVEPAGLNWTYINNELPKLYRYIKDHPKRSPNLTDKKKESLLAVTLESLHAKDAEIFSNLLRKDLKIKYLTPNIIKAAFPNIDI